MNATPDARIRVVSGRAVVLIGVSAFVCAIGAYIGSKFMQRAYMSTVSMMSAQEDTDRGAASRVTQQLGAVAGLLGVSAGARRDVNEGLATLRSRLLVAEFVKAEEFVDDLLDLVGPDVVAGLSEEDRLQEAVSYFQNNILTVSYDNRSTLMVVSITWSDRRRAAELANSYVAFANEALRQRTIKAARERIEFLDAAAKEAATVDLRQAIYQLVQEQVNAEMLAATKPEYAFVVVDPAVPAGVDEFVRPLPFLMAVVAAAFGALAAWAVLFFLGRLGGSLPRT